MKPAAFTDILLEGLAPDGGLAIPERYPRIDRAMLAAWRPLGYRELALEILSRFIDDIPRAELKAVVDRTYTAEVFGTDEITPVRTLEPGLHLLGLSNGPTLAFKDVAMQLLGGLFEHVLARRSETLNILGATSGDTGSAAEHAMRGRRGIRVFMLSPHGRMSPFQTAQMYSLADPNIFNLAIRGVFDDCQDIVKRVSADLAFKARHRIGTVNSINWARLLAQVVYYFKAYFAVTRNDAEEVSFAVPTGNFGNVCAGHVARMMGLPVRRLVVATNENDVLDEFFRTGRYGGRGSADVVATSSPSMDISKASNFERFAYDLVGRDPATVEDLWRRLDTAGSFDLAGTPHFARHRQLRLRLRAELACRPSGDDPRSRPPLRRGRRSAHGRRHQGRPRASRGRASRWSASRRRYRRSSMRRSARRWGVRRHGRKPTRISNRGRSDSR